MGSHDHGVRLVQDASRAVHLRCGVYQSIDARDAIPHLLRTLVRDFCPRLPQAVILSLLESWLDTVETPLRKRMRDARAAAAAELAGTGATSAGEGTSAPASATQTALPAPTSQLGGAAGDTQATSSSTSRAQFVVSVKRFVGAVLPLVCRTGRSLADPAVLQGLVRSSRTAHRSALLVACKFLAVYLLVESIPEFTETQHSLAPVLITSTSSLSLRSVDRRRF